VVSFVSPRLESFRTLTLIGIAHPSRLGPIQINSLIPSKDHPSSFSLPLPSSRGQPFHTPQPSSELVQHSQFPSTPLPSHMSHYHPPRRHDPQMNIGCSFAEDEARNGFCSCSFEEDLGFREGG